MENTAEVLAKGIKRNQFVEGMKILDTNLVQIWTVTDVFDTVMNIRDDYGTYQIRSLWEMDLHINAGRAVIVTEE